MTEQSAPPSATRRDERRVITVLFADLVGSTVLAERLDPEEVRLVVGEAIERIVGAIGEFDGYVKDLAGDGVLAFFGAPVGHEDDAERAMRAALRIIAEIDRYAGEVNQSWGVTGFGVRIGINTGPVVVGDLGSGTRVEYAAFGDTVNTAARLQASAAPGSILVAASTRRMLAPLFAWGPAQELELKGKAGRVTAHELRGIVAEADGELRPGRHGPLVGRDRELTIGREAVDGVLHGSGGLLLLTGEPGIGKSRLVQELHGHFTAGRPQAGRALWLEGRCVSYGESLPYWPYRDLLRDLIGVRREEPELRARVALRRTVDALFGERAEEIHPYLAQLLEVSLDGAAQARIAHLSPEALRYRTFEVVASLLARLAEDGPVTLVLDDLHWADPTSVALTEQLLPMVDDLPVLLVIAQRPERDHSSWQLKEHAERELPHRARELALEALSGDAERELLRALTDGEQLPAPVERRLLDVAEGNPFYLEELVRSLIDAGALVEHDGRLRFDHEVALAVPDTVEKVILARIDRLDPAARQLILAASVLGRRFSLELLQQVAGSDRAGDSLRTLQRLDLVREERRWPEREYRFKHALIQETAYRLLVTDDRRRLHRAAAQWLERQGHDREPHHDLLAHHWLAADDEERAIQYLTLAGDEASRSWALDEAIEHYRLLGELLERRGQRHEMAVVLFKLALALHTALRFAESNAIYQRAFDAWTPPEPPPATDAQLRIGTLNLPTQPDPARSYFLADIQLQMALFDRLVERWSEATIVPSLAERWTISDDGLLYRFSLREGLHWSDGTPLTAADVEFAVRRNLDPDRPAASVGLYLVLEGARDYFLGQHADPQRVGVRAVDERTVEFRLAAPAPYFMSLMNRSDAGPLPRHAIEEHGHDWTRPEMQVVSGAFQQTTRTPERVELARRETGSLPRRGNVAQVTMARMDEPGMAHAWEAGELDLALPPATALGELFASSVDDLHLGPPAFLLFLAFDFADPVLGTAAVRKALAHAIDRSRLAELTPPQLTLATGGVVPPVLQGHTPDIALRPDPALARRFYEEAGRPVARLRLAFREGGGAARLFEAITEMWSDALGIDAEPVPVDLEQFVVGEPFDSAPIVLRGWFPGYPDPEYFLRLLLHSDSTDVTSDPARRFSSKAFDELIESARQERDGQRRLELFHAADRLAITEEVAMIPLWYGRSPFLIKPRLHGWWEFGKSWSSFADLTLDRVPD